MSMLTRKATTRDMENKLKHALVELKQCREEIAQLLAERVDCEREIEVVNNNVSNMKAQLAELHIEHMDMLDQRDRLQEQVNSFGNCHETYSWSLQRISELEAELNEAHKTIVGLEKSIQDLNTSATNNMFKELIVTKQSQKSRYSNLLYIKSSRKLKKYLKLKKIVKKLEHVTKKHIVLSQSNSELVIEHDKILSDLENYSIQLTSSKLLYDQHTTDLKTQIRDLQCELAKTNSNHEKVMEDYISKYEEIAKIGKDNLKQVISLKKSNKCLKCIQSNPSLVNSNSEVSYNENRISVNKHASSVRKEDSLLSLLNQTKCSNDKVYIFSDQLGLGFSTLLKSFTNYSIVNNCYPNASFNHIINCLKNSNLEASSTIILLYGNCMSITKKDIIHLTEVMLMLNKKIGCRFITCALPYVQNVNKEYNKVIYNINLMMYNLTCRHSDFILYFETNNFVNNFTLTRDTMYLSVYYKRQLAKLLAYNVLHFDTGTCRVSKDLVSNSSTTISIDTGTCRVSKDLVSNSSATISIDTSLN